MMNLGNDKEMKTVMANEEMITPVPGIESLTYEDVNTILDFQRAWIKIFQWTRNYFRSALENHRDQKSVAMYVFQKLPMSIYRVLSKYLTEEESRKFFEILSNLIATMWRLVTAYKNNDRIAIDFNTAQWYQIADQLAAFFASVNNYLDEAQLKTLLYDYLGLTIQGIAAYFNGNYDLEIEIYNKALDKVSQIAAFIAMSFVAKRHFT